jgi:hypothetical protein
MYATSSLIQINGKQVECLLDSGAQTSFISSKFATQMNLKLDEVEKPRRWVTANNSPLKILGQATLQIKIGATKLSAPFVVSEDLAHEILIGTDILQGYSLTLCFNTMKLYCGEDSISITGHTPKKSVLVASKKKLEIEPNCCIVYRQRMDPYFAATEVLVEQAGVLPVTECVAAVKDGQVNIVIHNRTNFAMTINPRTVLCQISECEITASMSNDEELREFLRANCEVEYIADTKLDEEKVSSIATENKPDYKKPWKPSTVLKLDEKNLTAEQLSKIKALVDKYWMVFSRNDDDIGLVHESYGVHDIELTHDKPIKQRPYLIPHAKEKIVDELIDRMLRSGVISPGASPYASPIVLVAKGDSGSYRLCTDYRKINEITVKDAIPMPVIEQKLNRLHGCKFFSSVDCTSGYWQIRMSERAKQISAFVCSRGQFIMNTMPFGLCNAGSTFVRAIENIVNNECPASSAYIDDILTASAEFEQHLIDLEKLFIQLQKANMKIKTAKCKIAATETKFVGFKISAAGVEISDERVQAVKEYPQPKDAKALKSFLGLTSYYRAWIPKYTEIVHPLSRMLKKDTRFRWTQECTDAFELLKLRLTTAPILAFPQFDKPMHLSTDASNVGVGAVLFQIDEEGRERVIYYASRALNSAERNYATVERELLAVLYATDKFRYYLHSNPIPFVVYTDHRPLTYLKNFNTNSSRLTRWRLKLAELGPFEIRYKKGSANGAADGLSRSTREEKSEKSEDFIEALFAVSEVVLENRPAENFLKVHDEHILDVDEKNIVVCLPKNGSHEFGVASEMQHAFGRVADRELRRANIGECIVQSRDGLANQFYLVTKQSHTDQTNLQCLERCIIKLRESLQERNIKRVAIPKMDAGFEKIQWSKITRVLKKHLFDQGIEIDVYTNKKKLYLNAIKEDVSTMTDRIKQLQVEDPETKELREKVASKKARGYLMEDGVLLKWRRGRRGRFFKQIVIPRAMRQHILELCHDSFLSSHLGEKKTWEKLTSRFAWQSAYKDTIDYVRSCAVCAKIKGPPPGRAPLMSILDVEKPFDLVGMDILELSRTSAGNKYAVVFTDYVTKYVEAYPMPDQKAETIARIFINEIVARHSAPSRLLSDQGANLRSALIKNICDYLNTKKVQTAPYNPKCDGLTEKANHTLCRMLSAYSNENQTNWDCYLPLVLGAYRMSKHATTGYSPFELLYGRQPRLCDGDDYNTGRDPSWFVDELKDKWADAKANLVKHAVISEEYYNSKYKNPPPVYKEGGFVRVKKPQTPVGLKEKLRSDRWSEKVKINKVISDQNIEVVLPNQKTKVLNVNNVKHAELDRDEVLERIRSSVTTTQSGRLSKPRFKEH